jgi:hypothetical protein
MDNVELCGASAGYLRAYSNTLKRSNGLWEPLISDLSPKETGEITGADGGWDRDANSQRENDLGD